MTWRGICVRPWLQGLLLTNETERLDSLNLLLFMSPVALGVLVVATVVGPARYHSPRRWMLCNLNK